MVKKNNINDKLVTISLNVYESELKCIDEAVKLGKLRSRSSFISRAAVVHAKRINNEFKRNV